MSGGMWIVLGWVVVFALPLAVWLWAMFWPERIPPDRTVEAIRRRVEDEDGRSYRHGWDEYTG
ncbi:hypothetical protein [Nocardia wallacei]|uniref:hypothetical protein n=1 Tax=Nocardia wallacei TaxID=480035 RepID=UPI002455C28C|nr:hypothetical protein [Nocardia wallacei]